MSIRSRSTQSTLVAILLLASTRANADELPQLPPEEGGAPPVQIQEAPPPAARPASPRPHWRGAPPVVLLPPPAPIPPPPAEVAEDNSVLGTRQRFTRFEVGIRERAISDDAFAPFAKDNGLAQLSVSGSTVLFTNRSFSFAAGVGFDSGAVNASSRGFDMKLRAHQISVPLEGRFHVTPWLFAFAKAAPGISILRAEALESSLSQKLTSTSTAFAADLSLGASFLLGTQKHPQRRAFRVWLTPEVGYALATKASMDLEADDPRFGSMNLPGVSLGGFFARASVGFGF